MRRLVIDTSVYVDWINRGRHEDVLFDRGTVLIALSARSIGAAVVTQNESDYRAIQANRPFRLVVVPST
jgi:hypothetical protein